MKLTLIKELEAPLLARKRLNFEVDYSGSKTPSKEEVKKTIAVLQKVKEELISIRHIYPRFGKCKAKAIVHIYKTLQDLKKYEPKRKKEGKKAKSAVEQPKEEKSKEGKAEGKVNAKEESKEQKAK